MPATPRAPVPWAAYGLAYLAGFGVATFLLVLPRWVYFSGLSFDERLAVPSAIKLALIIYGVLTPLAGIVVFRLFFGRLARRWRGRAFWLVAPLVVYAILGMVVAANLGDVITTPETRLLMVLLPLIAGLVALRLTGK